MPAGQIERRSAVEQDVPRVLAVEREPVKITELVAELGPLAGSGAFLDAVHSLSRRSLAEGSQTTGAAAFTLQSVMLEYVTDRMVKDVSDEIAQGQPLWLVRQPHINAKPKTTYGTLRIVRSRRQSSKTFRRNTGRTELNSG